MLKWSRTPQQTRRSTVPGVSGEPGGIQDGEVTPTPSPKPSSNKMDVELQNGVGSTSESQVATKYTKKVASNLTRTDSGKSSKSNKSLGTLSAFDPDSAGTLSRSTEVTYTVYDDTTPTDDAHQKLHGSSSFGAVDPQSSSQQGDKSTTTRTSTTTTSYKSSTTGGTASHNGDIHINGDLNAMPSTSKEIKSTKMTTKGISASDSKIPDLSPDTKETNASIINTLDNLLVDLDDHDKSFDETMATVSLDRKLVSQRPKNPTKKVGAFSIRSAFDEKPLDKKTLSNTSLHDDKFKGDLSTKLLNGHQEKAVNLSDPHLNKTTYSSIKSELTTLKSSTGKFGSGQEIANILDKNPQMSSGRLTNGVAASEDIANYNGHDPSNIDNEVIPAQNSKTSSSVISSTTAQSEVVGDRSSTRRTSQESSTTTSVTRTASQKSSDQNNNLSRPTSRATVKSEVRSSVARSESGRSATPPQFKVRDIRGSLSRPSSSISGGDRRESSTFGAYSPNRTSYSSSSTREEISVARTNIVTTSTGGVKRVDSGASASSRQGTEASSKRTSVVSTASAGAAPAVNLPDVVEDQDKASQKSTSQRTSLISTTSLSSITGKEQSPTRISGISVSRTSSAASHGVQVEGSTAGSRPTSGRSRKRPSRTGSQRQSPVDDRPASQISKAESQVSRSESKLSRASSNTSSDSPSSVTSYNFSGKEKLSIGSDTDDKFINSVGTEQREQLQNSEVTVVEKVSTVYTNGKNLKAERITRKETRSSKGEALPTSSTSVVEKSEIFAEGKRIESPEPQTSSHTETNTNESVFTTDDPVKTANYTGYTTQSSYNSLTSTESLRGDRSFRRSASNLLDDFKSGRLTSAESTLEKSHTSNAVTSAESTLEKNHTGDGGKVSASTSSSISRTKTVERPSDINLMGVSSLDKTSTSRDNHYESTARQTYDVVDRSLGASGGQQTVLNGDKSPSSPTVEEAQKAVTPGIVNKLSKDVFANLNLTGRFIDPSTLQRSKTPDPSEEKEEESEKKYKFLVEGIDIPAQEEEIQAEVAIEEKAELSPSLDSLERKTKGFSYVKIVVAWLEKFKRGHRQRAQRNPMKLLK